ncbi:ATP-dependent translocase ABCB1-like isoform X2 [Xenia sp. Carnegie-2017]|uniref:ATP-dependent translocase ABCB1-like isoform X2 n=1 Tax=Xenia sp. Carnegie-2017 TaxID=2897299 RepID=UPI001F046A5F|nr:ATP-dependent translocase ABCB1-like isoform X2 [Xenia sp. Carnegie-2017]
MKYLLNHWFIDKTDKVLLILATIGCFIYGFVSPAQFIIFGKSTDDFVEYTLWKMNISNSTEPDLEESLTTIALWYIAIAFANFSFAWMGLGLFGLAAQRQAYKMRAALFRNAIYQEVGWFDENSSGELNFILSDQIDKVADGIGYKLGNMVSCLVSLIAGHVIGFIYCWQISLILASLFPVMIVLGTFMAKATEKYTREELVSYGKAGHVAEQSISSIRTVAAFGGEHKQSELYNEHLGEACKLAIKKGRASGIFIGTFMLALYSNYGIAIWYLIHLVKNGDASPGDGLTAFFAITTTAAVLGQTATSSKAIAAAKAAGYTILNIIDRQSNIDASTNNGLTPVINKGVVEFLNVDFVYPTRKSLRILQNFSLKIPSGKTVALVGESGCGKSTVVKLIERFYDPVQGAVFIDGYNIKDINVSHLRGFVGIVNQEPVLFSGTIAENIAYGFENVSQLEIEEAAKLANAHDFIKKFPQGYQTQCGERGAKMSGGQKQRIAIARALVRNPKILLLDEATSALDSESEAVVQEALDRAGKGRTTIVIAHRLSTIKKADMIVAIREGKVIETGTHDELMSFNGLYSSLVKLQDQYQEDDNFQNKDDDDMDAVVKEEQAFQLKSLSTVSQSEDKSRHSQLQTEHDDIPAVSFWTILKMNAPEWKSLFVGCIGAGLWGAYPVFYGIAFGKIYEAFGHDTRKPKERDAMDDEARDLLFFYLFIAFSSGLGGLLRDWFLSKAGEPLTQRLRELSFSAYMRQETSYFDVTSHGTGAICTSLAVDVSVIKGATGPQLGLLLGAVVSVIGGLIVAFTGSWQLTLIMLGFMPLLFFAGLLTHKLSNALRHTAQSDESIASSGQVAEETFSNILTVVSLGQERKFIQKYKATLSIPLRKAKWTSQFSGLATGSMMGTVSLSLAVVFRYGGYLIVKGDITVAEMMKSIVTILVVAIMIGQVASITPDYYSAKVAADKVFYLIGNTPHIDCYSNAGKIPNSCNGEIEFKDVQFRYPTRRNMKVLRSLTMTIKPGQTVAVVGTSGCGKSTTIALIERMYDINSGFLMIDGEDVRELNLKWLRSQIGLVSQEPVLFDLSIRDNIAYGDTTKIFADKDIEIAAKSANIHDFISSLPKGYETMVGDKGTLLSGGQKQRIAIARALIRDPKILLLDEATSALDSESEKIVQEALEKASIGRTTIIIAHRLSTIQNADAILVLRKGRVVERGTHHQLMMMKGIYYALHKSQS